MDNRTLLELAAKAAGKTIDQKTFGEYQDAHRGMVVADGEHWNPLDDDGDALRLAVKLNLDIRYESYDAGVAVIVGAAWDDAPEAIHEIFERDGPRAVRLAITRAAADIGRSME